MEPTASTATAPAEAAVRPEALAASAEKSGILPLTRAQAAGAAVACGVFYFFAFPGLDLWPFAFITLVPLRLALVGRTPKQAAFLGWLSGMTMVSIGFYWMLNMMQEFSGFSTPLCMFFVGVVNAFVAGRIGLFAWLFVRAERNGWQPGLGFLAAFVASELCYPVLFFWSFGAVVHPVPLFTQIADLGGVYAVGLVVVAFNWALAELIIARLSRKKPDYRRLLPYALAPVAAALYGAVRIQQVDARVAAAEPAHVGLVQANMGLMEKRRSHDEGLRRHIEETQRLRAEGPLDLVLWSETSVMHAVRADQATELLPRIFTRELGVPTVFGAVLYDKVNDARRRAYYNSVLLSDASGDIVGRYDKQELVAFSERMPLGEDFPILFEISPNSSNFRAGKSVAPLRLGDHHIAAMVCNDDVSPSLGNRLLADPKTDLLVNLTNDAWFGDTTEPWIHLGLAKFRAVEHRRFFVRSTNSGVSAFIDPVGRVFAQSETFKEQTLRGEIRWLSGRTGYEIVGNVPYWIATALVVAAAFMKRKRAAVTS